jgi:predicted HAD superfamily Cof-like phosphohydrolase
MIEEIKYWFEAAIPKPTDKTRAVQIGCHYEEVAEMQDAVGDDGINAEWLANYYKKTCLGIGMNEVDRIAMLDALCDQIVTAVGVAHMFGMDIEGALAEVNRSNWSKFVQGEPQFNADGKIIKGPHYTPPEIAAFCNNDAQSEGGAA